MIPELGRGTLELAIVPLRGAAHRDVTHDGDFIHHNDSGGLGTIAGDLTERMPTTVWTADLLISKLEQLRTAGSKSNPALHKPLLLLLLLSKMENGTITENVILYRDIEEELHDLLRDFGWKSTSYHPEYPFHHLASQGYWSYELRGAQRQLHECNECN